jgi:hypothetical protein
MSSRPRDDDDEDRWLLARERGEPGPAIADATAAKYTRLHSLIEDRPAVPAGFRPRSGWQQAVLDAIDRGEAEPTPAHSGTLPAQSIDIASRQRTGNKRRIVTVACGLAVAASVTLALKMMRAEPSAELSVIALATAQTTRGEPHELVAGGKAAVRGAIDGPGELRVYDADDVELARCSVTGPDCTVERSGKRTELRLEVALRVAGPLHLVLFSAPIPGPSGGRAGDLEAANRAGILVKPLEKVVR